MREQAAISAEADGATISAIVSFADLTLGNAVEEVLGGARRGR